MKEKKKVDLMKRFDRLIGEMDYLFDDKFKKNNETTLSVDNVGKLDKKINTTTNDKSILSRAIDIINNLNNDLLTPKQKEEKRKLKEIILAKSLLKENLMDDLLPAVSMDKEIKKSHYSYDYLYPVKYDDMLNEKISYTTLNIIKKYVLKLWKATDVKVDKNKISFYVKGNRYRGLVSIIHNPVNKSFEIEIGDTTIKRKTLSFENVMDYISDKVGIKI